VGNDIETQTWRVMENVKAVLGAAGTTFDRVVKTTIFLKSMGDFPKVNEIYGSYFSGPTSPARSTVEVARLPKELLVEIEVIAYLPEFRFGLSRFFKKQVLSGRRAPIG